MMQKHETFEKVYRRTSEPLLKFISKKLNKDQHMVEDIFQETMVAAYKGWNTFENKSKYMTWLCRISLNKIADYYRRNIHQDSRIIVPLIEEFDSRLNEELTPEEQVVLADLRFNVKECLKLLPFEYREVLELRYFKHYSYKKMALILETSERSIEGKLYRARKALREVLLERQVGLSVIESTKG